MKDRNLKISYAYDSHDQKIPYLKLSGKWLRECGFEIGAEVIIKCEKDKLIITPRFNSVT